MESDFATENSQPNKDEDVSCDAEADIVILHETSITNGATDQDGGQNEEFIEEELVQMDPMADLEEEDIGASKKEQVPEKITPEPEEEEELEQEEAPVSRTPTQVPKKRRGAALLAAAAAATASDGYEEEEVLEAEFQDVENDNAKEILEESTQIEMVQAIKTERDSPTSSNRAKLSKAEEPSVNEEQCRVCTTTEDLVSLFKKVETHTVAELLMIICPTVTIARKDFMPQYICNTCLDNVTIAVQLKSQCEATEKELRKKLSRSKNKVRRPAGYVVIDAPIESDPPSEEEPKDDIEFKVSDVEASASGEDDSSDDSDFNTVATKKKRSPRGSGRGGRGGRRRSAITPTPKTKEKKRPGRPPIRRMNDSTAEEDGGEIAIPTKKKKQKMSNEKDPIDKEFPCDECAQVFTRKLSLVLHKKAHSGRREPINCEVCGKQFKIQGAYRSHLEKHKDESASMHSCDKCSKSFMTKGELRKHVAEVHEDLSVYFTCETCKRVFTTQARLQRHQESRCPGFEVKTTRRPDFENFGVGKDLFKSVAPLTTTYWSDSFSD